MPCEKAFAKAGWIINKHCCVLKQSCWISFLQPTTQRNRL